MFNFYIGNTYNVVSVFIVISCLLACVLTILPKIIDFKSYTHFQEKNSSYECGFEPFSSAHKTFDIHFVVVAILFLLFDFELLLVVPYVVGYSHSLFIFGPFSMFNLFFFLFVLLFGFFYEWFQGVLVWPIFVKPNSNY